MSENAEVTAPAPVHDHPHATEVFIPKWVLWSATGLAVGVLAWVVWEAYAETRQLAANELVRQAFEQSRRPLLDEEALKRWAEKEAPKDRPDENKASDTVL